MRGTRLLVAALAVVAGLTSCEGCQPAGGADRYERFSVVNNWSVPFSVEAIRSHHGGQAYPLEPDRLDFAVGERKKFAIRQVAATDYATGFSCDFTVHGTVKHYDLDGPDLVSAIMVVSPTGDVLLFGMNKNGEVVSMP